MIHFYYDNHYILMHSSDDWETQRGSGSDCRPRGECEPWLKNKQPQLNLALVPPVEACPLSPGFLQVSLSFRPQGGFGVVESSARVRELRSVTLVPFRGQDSAH